MKRINGLIVLSAALFTLEGCFLNPYKSDFQCPKTETGECVSVQRAYDKSVGDGRKKNEGQSMKDLMSEEHKSPQPGKSTLGIYQDALYSKMAGLLGDPVTPMIAPPTVLRVLIFPYRGDGNRLFMPRFAYVILEDPQWILDEMKAGGAE
jgi:conjugal transfer pilus assembly protein TraV